MDAIVVSLIKSEPGGKQREAKIWAKDALITVQTGLRGSKRHKREVTPTAKLEDLNSFINEQIVKLVEGGYEVESDSRDRANRTLFVASQGAVDLRSPEALDVITAFGAEVTDDGTRFVCVVPGASVTVVRRASGQCAFSATADESHVAMSAAWIRLLDPEARMSDSDNALVSFTTVLQAAAEAGRLSEGVVDLLRKRRVLPGRFDLASFRTKPTGSPLALSM